MYLLTPLDQDDDCVWVITLNIHLTVTHIHINTTYLHAYANKQETPMMHLWEATFKFHFESLFKHFKFFYLKMVPKSTKKKRPENVQFKLGGEGQHAEAIWVDTRQSRNWRRQWISQISFWVLVTEALLNLEYKTIRETNCLREHSLSDLLLLCLPKLNWRAYAFF